MRLTLDYWEDYIMLSSIKSLLDTKCERKDVIKLLNNFPILKKINWFRNQDWANKQSIKLDKLIKNRN